MSGEPKRSQFIVEAVMSHEKKFMDYVEATFPLGEKRSRSAAIHREYGDRIVSYLNQGWQKR